MVIGHCNFKVSELKQTSSCPIQTAMGGPKLSSGHYMFFMSMLHVHVSCILYHSLTLQITRSLASCQLYLTGPIHGESQSMTSVPRHLQSGYLGTSKVKSERLDDYSKLWFWVINSQFRSTLSVASRLAQTHSKYHGIQVYSVFNLRMQQHGCVALKQMWHHHHGHRARHHPPHHSTSSSSSSSSSCSSVVVVFVVRRRRRSSSSSSSSIIIIIIVIIIIISSSRTCSVYHCGILQGQVSQLIDARLPDWLPVWHEAPESAAAPPASHMWRPGN